MLATTEQWKSFCPEWERVLAIDPPVSHWHQSDAYAGVHDFAALTSRERRERAILLARIIRDMQPRIVTVSMNRDFYNRARFTLPKKARRTRNLVCSPYALPQGYLMQVLDCELETLEAVGPINMVFEASNDRQRDASMILTLRDHKEEHIGTRKNLIGDITVRPGKSTETRPLEAADLALWCMRRAISGRPNNPICDALGNTQCGIVEVPEEWVQYYVELANRHAGDDELE